MIVHSSVRSTNCANRQHAYAQNISRPTCHPFVTLFRDVPRALYPSHVSLQFDQNVLAEYLCTVRNSIKLGFHQSLSDISR